MMDVGAIGDAAIVRVTEEIDFVSAPRLEHIIKIVGLAGPGRVVFSLEQCRYWDSTCLGIVLRAVSRHRRLLAERVLGVRSACHRSFHTNGSLIDGCKKCALRLVCISRLSERSMGADQSHGPRRQQQTGRQMGI
jgi:anti-anti-sigma factor